MWNRRIDCSNYNQQTGRWIKKSLITLNYAPMQDFKVAPPDVRSDHPWDPADALKRWPQAFLKIVHNSFFD
jgi:hypothetical protein